MEHVQNVRKRVDIVSFSFLVTRAAFDKFIIYYLLITSKLCQSCRIWMYEGQFTLNISLLKGYQEPQVKFIELNNL